MEERMSDKPRMVVQDDIVVSMAYILTVDNEITDQSEEGMPLEFIQGTGQILPALEDQLYGMAVGDSKKVHISAAEGYGEIDTEAIADIPREELPKKIPLKKGIELTLRDQDGADHYAVIVGVDDHHVRLDFNHPLAGKDLDFTVRITALRSATPEEIEHGHVHEDKLKE
jgi:FKBP-type peptidyl-prolyl cis-trans isomerase SlyD